MDLASLTSCRELTAEHADAAARSAAVFRSLLARVADIAEPEDGAPKILMVLARLARGDVPWIEGEITVEIVGDDQQTTLDVFGEEGWGIKERLAPHVKLPVPFDEFERAVEISAKRFAPLKPDMKPGKIVLSNADSPATAAEPPPVQLDEKSVATAPPPALVAQEPEPFEMPAAAEPEPFAPSASTEAEAETEGGFGPFLDEPEVDPALAAAIVSPKKKPPSIAMPDPSDPTPAAAPARPANPPKKAPDPVHSRPTVRRMVAIKPEALRTGRKDPRREDDD